MAAKRERGLEAALQFRDELEALKKEMYQGSEKLSARTTELRWSGGAHDQLRELAEQILELLARGPKTMGDLYRQCSVCELKIYQVVTELLYSDQVSFADAVDQSNGEVAPTIKRDLEAKGVQLTQP